MSHCLPNGYLGTNELPCPNVSAASIATVHATTGVGQKRGVIVMCHGLQTNPSNPIPVPIVDQSGALQYYLGSFANMMAADGWEVIQPIYQEDTYSGSNPGTGLFNDMNTDTGFGLRYLNSSIHWWDHVVEYIYTTYGRNIPIMAFGVSLGGAKVMHIVNKHPNSFLKAFIAHIPASHLEVANTFWVPMNFGLLNCSGIDTNATDLNPVTIPGIIGTGTADSALGSTYSTIAAGTGAITAAAVAAAGNLYVASFTNFVAGVRVLVTGLTGGTGQAVFNFTGTSAAGGNHLTGVTLISGSGTLATGLLAIQNLSPLIVANQNTAQPGTPITLNVTPGNHELTQAEAGQYTTPTGITGSVALSTLTSTLNVGQTLAGGNDKTNLVSGACAIQDTTGVWHDITFGGSTSTTLTTVTYSGSNAALVNNTSPICQTNYAVGGSYPYWIMKNVDPLCPKAW